MLPPGSVHQIRNAGPGRMVALTTMTPDDGFADLILAGPADELDEDDLAAVRGLR